MWLTGWQYRKRITIQGQSGAGSGYQVLLKVGESSGASGYDFHVEGHSAKFPSDKNDSGDLRFTSSDEITLLPIWVEKVEGTSPNRVAYVWIKISDNLDNNVDIYCYYGNIDASNVSNVNNTFIRVIDGLVGSWHFDEGSGNTVYDTSGNNNDGTIHEASWVDGKFGKALNFDGSNDYVEVPDSPSLDITDEITIETWIKPATAQGSGNCKYPVCKSYSYILSYDHFLEEWKGTLALYDGTDWRIPSTGVSISHGVWHHFVGVYSPPYEIIYLDGTEKLNENIGSFSINTSTNNLWFGAHVDKSEFYDGVIDEIRIYNRALNSNEILDLYNNYGYTTPNYPGKVLVRKRVDPEPSFSSATSEEESKTASSITASNHFKFKLMSGDIDFDAHTFKICLMQSGFTFDKDNHATWSDVSSYELPTGNGYTQGGKTLQNVQVQEDDVNDRCVVSWDDIGWQASGGDLVTPGAIVYDDDTSDDTVVMYIEFDNGNDVTIKDGMALYIENIKIIIS